MSDPLPGEAEARELGRKIELRRQHLGIPTKQLVAEMGLESESAWTKRTRPEAKDWVPFKSHELLVLKRLLAPDEPGWPLLDETQTKILARGLKRALTGDEPAKPQAEPGT